MRSVLLTLSVAALASFFLAGCATQATKDRAAIDDYCHQCAIYVGDYSHENVPPKVDADTQAAMERMEAEGQTSHIGDMAATIVRRYRDDPRMKFDPATNDVDRQLTRWVKSQFGADQPWKPARGTTTVAHVYKWIAANRAKLPASKLLDDELSKAG